MPFSVIFVKNSQSHEEFGMELYARIEELCRENGINITEMCRQTNLTRAKLSDLKMGRSKSLSAQTLSKIAGFFGVSVDYLLGEGERPQRAPATESDIKVALFGGSGEVTDEMWAEVMSFVEYVKSKNGIK